jgi:hypothetical protein
MAHRRILIGWDFGNFEVSRLDKDKRTKGTFCSGKSRPNALILRGGTAKRPALRERTAQAEAGAVFLCGSVEASFSPIPRTRRVHHPAPRG